MPADAAVAAEMAKAAAGISEIGGRDAGGAASAPAAKTPQGGMNARGNPVKLVKDFVRAATHPRPPPMPEAQQWECGETRTILRNEFNTKEIDAATLIAKYDANGNRVLETNELAQLLQDFNGGMLVKPEELDFIMKIADVNRDKAISEEEVLCAVRVWYANNMMPESVTRAMTRYNIGLTGPMPSSEKLQELLETLNDSSPVKEAEVTYVRLVAAFLGGRDDEVTSQIMWRAIACWYLHIERCQTDDYALWRHAFSSLHAKLVDLNICRKVQEGQRINFRARGPLVITGVVVTAVIVIPLVDIMVAQANPSTLMCQSPHLSSVLWWTGMTALIDLALLLLAIVAMNFFPQIQLASIVLWSAFGVFLVSFLMLYVMGSVTVSYCTSASCGMLLWHYCHLCYVVIPVCLMLFGCCGLPGLYCYLGSTEFLKEKAVDAELGNRLVSTPAD